MVFGLPYIITLCSPRRIDQMNNTIFFPRHCVAAVPGDFLRYMGKYPQYCSISRLYFIVCMVSTL